MGAKIVIDGVFFQIARTGIARVWIELLQYWKTSGYTHDLVVLDRHRTCPRIDGVRYRDAPAFSYGSGTADRRMLQSICVDEQASLFISTYYTFPLTTPSAMLVYDMIPEMLGWNLHEPMWHQKQQALHHAEHFAAISEQTARDLRLHLRQPTLPVEVAYPGTRFSAAPPDAVATFRAKYGLQRPYFLITGSRSGYKNVGLFFEVFAALGDDRARYSILCTGGGPVEPQFAAQAGPAELQATVLDDSELQCAYTGAVALVYPSLYEGFGLPLAEAMSCDCPVITMRVSSIPEVGGDAPLYVEPGGSAASQLAAHLVTVQDPSVRRSMVERGRVQATRFRWETMGSALETFLNKATAPFPHAEADACRLCNAPTHFIFTNRVLQRHDVEYRKCNQCEAVQTEKPYWLKEAYTPENEMFDTGQVTRSLINAAVLGALLPACEMGPQTRIVDYGCGSGLLVRTMRDMGWDTWGYDRYCKPRLALGFQTDDFRHFDVVNACEVVEHFDEPRVAFDGIFSTRPKLVVLHTGIANDPTESWDYLASEHGQHIFFMAPRTLSWLCEHYDRVLVEVLGFHVLVSTDIAARLVVPGTGRLKLTLQAAFDNMLGSLFQSMFTRPYHYALRDNLLLRERCRAEAFPNDGTAHSPPPSPPPPSTHSTTAQPSHIPRPDHREQP